MLIILCALHFPLRDVIFQLNSQTRAQFEAPLPRAPQILHRYLFTSLAIHLLARIKYFSRVYFRNLIKIWLQLMKTETERRELQPSVKFSIRSQSQTQTRTQSQSQSQTRTRTQSQSESKSGSQSHSHQLQTQIEYIKRWQYQSSINLRARSARLNLAPIRR